MGLDASAKSINPVHPWDETFYYKSVFCVIIHLDVKTESRID